MGRPSPHNSTSHTSRSHVCSTSHMFVPPVTCLFHQSHVCFTSHMFLPPVTCLFHQSHVSSTRHMSVPPVTCLFHQSHASSNAPPSSNDGHQRRPAHRQLTSPWHYGAGRQFITASLTTLAREPLPCHAPSFCSNEMQALE